MFETGVLVAAIVWAISALWLVVSLLRLIVPRWRRSGLRQTMISAVTCVLSFVGVIWCNQFVYLDYGLTSRAGLEEARAAKKAERAAEKAVTDAKAEQERQAAAKVEAEEAAKQAILDARQAALDAEQRKKDAEAQAAKKAAKKAAALAKKCNDTTMAFVMSQTFVKRNLKAPSTAEFPWITDDQVAISTKPDCGFRVIGWVDAQNGFGAQIRSKYVVDLKYLDDEAGTWQLTDINIR
jgi:hypothetical protein